MGLTATAETCNCARGDDTNLSVPSTISHDRLTVLHMKILNNASDPYIVAGAFPWYFDRRCASHRTPRVHFLRRSGRAVPIRGSHYCVEREHLASGWIGGRWL